LGVFIFPKDGQDQDQQNTDELACYTWAKEQTGYDPMNPTLVRVEQVDNSADGTALKGAIGGAAAGAAIGAISRHGDAGEGAAIGAILGGIRAGAAKKRREAQQQAQNEAMAKAQMQEMAAHYLKGFSACMEAKGYTIK
ncbi:MAG: hypothetical protein KJO53_12645, partial [Eudoraea sp.]|nr:hypothetical protein [Eudoraea sp.]